MLGRLFTALRAYGFGNQRTVPSLDGMRAVSIMFVLFAHLSLTRHFPVNLGALGQFGVRVFFVISGYLITSILLKELDRRGSISLGRFYFRRTLRLFPAAYLFIGVVTLLTATHNRLGGLMPRDLAFALTYTMNYHEVHHWNLGHLWSLAVEEQFYLIWPVTLKFLGLKRSTQLMIWVFAVVPFLRLLAPYVWPAFNFVVWTDALATGCLLAILWNEPHQNARYMRLLASKWFAIVPLVPVLMVYAPTTRLSTLLFDTIMNVSIALCIDWSIQYSHGKVGRFLNAPFISFVGVLSYSLYLWQQIFLNAYSDSRLTVFPLNVGLAICAALLSYLLVEVPILHLRDEIERRSGFWTLPAKAQPAVEPVFEQV